MTRIILRGCCGRMGKIITEIAAEDDKTEIVAGIDIFNNNTLPYPVFGSLSECNVEGDVLIDFAAAKDIDLLLKEAVKRKLPLVLCTTGYDKEQLELINSAAKSIAVLRSANMSVGINVISKVLKAISSVLNEEGFDIEIVEKHHNQKLDAPSGTALMLADTINSALSEPYEYCYDRSQEKRKRPKKEIGISAVRGGSIVGEHEVIFAGLDEVIEVRHTAYSRAIFGKGAVAAAKFLAGKPSGMYNMNDVIG